MFRWIKKYLPSHHSLKQQKSLQPILHLLDHPELWKLHTDNVSKGVAIGLFINFIPIPFQMLWAASLSILFRANLPIAVALTWINNPFTFIGINFLTYKIGAWLLGKENNISLSDAWHWKVDGFQALWHNFPIWFSTFGKAYLLGLPIISLGTAFLGYWIVQGIGKFSKVIHKPY